MSIVAYAIIAAVALQRLLEVAWATRNTTRLKAQGAVEIGASHYPLIVLLHAAWLCSDAGIQTAARQLSESFLPP